MRRRVIQLGLSCIIAAVLLITAVTFFHGELVSFIFLDFAEERLVSSGLFGGGIIGGFGVVVAAVGVLLGSAKEENNLRLAPYLIILGAAIIIFVLLFYSSLRPKGFPKLRPGETITI